MIAQLNEEIQILGIPNIWVFLIILILAMAVESVVIGGIIFGIYDFIRNIVERKKNEDSN